jgi:long-chain acyl-CoA synthetase
MLPLESFLERESKHPNKVYLRQPYKGEWIDYTWSQVGNEARKLASAIKALDLPAKSNIATLSKNCAHWIITDIAIMMSGHVSVPLYPTLSADSINYVLNHSDTKLLFAGKLDEWEKQKVGVPQGLKTIHFPLWENSDAESWDQFIGNHGPLMNIPTSNPDELFTIIYTSGTTGNPKGVVHTFNSASTHVRQALTKLDLNENERFFSYLPLSHVAERVIIEMASLYIGGTVYFAESLDSFKDNLVYCRPTIFLAVPRIWLKFQEGVLAKMPQKKLNLFLSIPLLNNVVRKKILSALGLDEVKYTFSGAAAMPLDLLKWYDKLNIKIFEAYGMTENMGISCLALPTDYKYGYVGKTWEPNTEVKIADNGEVLSRSEANMQGYFKNPEKTAETIDADGWLHTVTKVNLIMRGTLKSLDALKMHLKHQKGSMSPQLKLKLTLKSMS